MALIIIRVDESSADDGTEELHEHVEEGLAPGHTSKHCLAECDLNEDKFI